MKKSSLIMKYNVDQFNFSFFFFFFCNKMMFFQRSFSMMPLDLDRRRNNRHIREKTHSCLFQDFIYFIFSLGPAP